MPAPWEEHSHEAVVHSHDHYHVTHNFNERTGGFEHLSSSHSHEHDHAALNHDHYPHQDFDQEHRGEAHMHDHSHPVSGVRASMKKAEIQKAGPATKVKAGAKKVKAGPVDTAKGPPQLNMP